MKCLLPILFVCALVLLGNSPITKNSSPDSKTPSESYKNKPTQAPTVQNTIDSGAKSKRDQTAESGKDSTHPEVTISAIPRVNVKRDWFDYATLGVGILLTLVGASTGAVIWYQSEQTRIAAQASLESARATRDSVDLQKTAFVAWVVTDNWHSGRAQISEPDGGFIPIVCEIVNPTKFPITLEFVKIAVLGDGEVAVRNKRFLPPDGRYPASVNLAIEDAKRDRTGGVAFQPFIDIVNVFVEYTDVLGRPGKQHFGMECTVMTHRTDFRLFTAAAPEPHEGTKQKGEQKAN
jgi:hypothetical protein